MRIYPFQNTQNRDNDIFHLKIDELIRATKAAQNATLCLEKMGTHDLRKLRAQYSALGEAGEITFNTTEGRTAAAHFWTYNVGVPVTLDALTLRLSRPGSNAA
ncbi:low affinity iron permease family protein [Pseudomonas sp. PD9R]|uniref:low affinity iron permease family protein n=1 Tax=Pseudomonas sp. PD9R TaxID=2853534 RepID=UPI003525568B